MGKSPREDVSVSRRAFLRPPVWLESAHPASGYGPPRYDEPKPAGQPLPLSGNVS